MPPRLWWRWSEPSNRLLVNAHWWRATPAAARIRICTDYAEGRPSPGSRMWGDAPIGSPPWYFEALAIAMRWLADEARREAS